MQTSLQPVATDVLTLATFTETYAERLGRPVSRNHTSCVTQLLAWEVDGRPFGQKALASITDDDLEAFFSQLRAAGKAASTRNWYVQAVKALFRKAARKGYLPRDPAADLDALKREKHAQRARRLAPGEEAAFLTHAGPHLHRLIVAALETGCRKGELLSLTWADVSLERRELTVRAEKAKTRTGRVVPISDRLRAVLEVATTDPAGETFTGDTFVFGDAVGQQVTDVKKAWETAVLKAHGHTPKWDRRNALDAASREAFRAVGLTFHDLRHEAGSRLLEAGWPLHHVAHMLGHANISQTSTYLNATRVGLQDAMRRLDASRSHSPSNEQQPDEASGRQDQTQGAEADRVN